ncbi:hypothetical protein F4809DRAFT_638837 [Biscogniauxia mediterranea]|nr:hypothetical protein F4809DRAFT_638837 [Biscogniauxia mediterranea]
MTLHSNEAQQPTTGFPTTDSESDVKEDAHSDVDDEEEMKKWLSTTYERGSKKPMKKPLTAHWGLMISDADVEKLKAKKEAVILSRGHLHCEFETLPHYPSSMFWDSSAYKKLDAE